MTSTDETCSVVLPTDAWWLVVLRGDYGHHDDDDDVDVDFDVDVDVDVDVVVDVDVDVDVDVKFTFVCTSEWKRTIYSALYMFGMLFGSYFFGWSVRWF